MINREYMFYGDTALGLAIDEYKSVTERINNTVKCITSLLICLGGIVTAVAALFTAYCICMPKNSWVDYLLFAINILIILVTFFIDCIGISPSLIGKMHSEMDGYLNGNEYNRIINKTVLLMDTIYENENVNSSQNVDNDRELKVAARKIIQSEIGMYRNASQNAARVLHIKRRFLCCAIMLTFLCIVVLGISVLVTMQV